MVVVANVYIAHELNKQVVLQLLTKASVFTHESQGVWEQTLSWEKQDLIHEYHYLGMGGGSYKLTLYTLIEINRLTPSLSLLPWLESFMAMPSELSWTDTCFPLSDVTHSASPVLKVA